MAEYRDKSLDLNYADDDVTDLGEFLGGYRGSFAAVHRLELTNAEATRDALPRIESFLQDAGVDDTVILMVSGHGGYE